MDNTAIIEELKAMIQPLLTESGFELVELNFSRSRFSSTLSVFADRIGGGITIDDCAMLNRKIGDLLEAQDIIQEKYLLEVSSPGIDRLLTTKNDFSRCIGKNVKFFLREAINGKIEVDGKVLKVDDVIVTIEEKKGNLDIPLFNINKARQIV
ncbi:MAG: ribosome maturation factor RimP [Candidatus Omnitrophota bacterium]